MHFHDSTIAPTDCATRGTTKPSIAHFAIGVIMLKPAWMLRYVPAWVREAIPREVTIAGYAWAALMFLLGAGTVSFAIHGDLKLWALYMSP